MEEHVKISIARLGLLTIILSLVSTAAYVYFQENKIAEIQNAAAQDVALQGHNAHKPSGNAQVDITKKNLVGIWQSNSDSKSRVMFYQNGTFREQYEGEFIDKGSWSLHTSLAGTEYDGVDYEETMFLKEASLADNIPTYFTISTDGKILKLGSLTLQKMLIYTRVH